MNSAISSAAKLRWLLIVSASAVLLSCGNKNSLSNHIPKESTLVVRLDVKSMALKSVNFKDVFTLDNLKKIAGRSGEKSDSASAMSNPGIDFTSDAYIFGVASAEGKYGGLLAGLSDAAAFEAFLKASDNSIDVTKDAELGISFVTLGDGAGLIAFDKKSVYAVVGDSGISKDLVMRIVNLKKEESLAAVNDSFKALEKEGGDISIWVSFDDIMKLIPQYTAAVGQASFTETYATAVCNFEDGQIVVDGKYTTNAEMAEKSKMMKGSVSKDVARTLPGQSVIGVFGFAMDMDRIYSELEKMNSVAPVDPIAQQMTGMSVKDIMHIFSGDVAVSLNGLKMKEVQSQNPYSNQTMTSTQPEADYTAAIGITDKEKLHALLEKFSGTGMLMKTDKFYVVKNLLFIAEHNDIAVITATEARMRSVLDGKTEPINSELTDLLTSNAYAMEFNLNNIPDDFFTNKAVLDNMRNSEVTEFICTATAISEKTSNAKFVLKFKEKKENALVTISRVSKKFKSLRAPVAVPDSTAVPSL